MGMEHGCGCNVGPVVSPASVGPVCSPWTSTEQSWYFSSCWLSSLKLAYSKLADVKCSPVWRMPGGAILLPGDGQTDRYLNINSTRVPSA